MRRIGVRGVVAVVLLVGAAAADAQSPPLVTTNARVRTGDTAAPWAEAVALAGSGSSMRRWSSRTTSLGSARSA